MKTFLITSLIIIILIIISILIFGKNLIENDCKKEIERPKKSRYIKIIKSNKRRNILLLIIAIILFIIMINKLLNSYFVYANLYNLSEELKNIKM